HARLARALRRDHLELAFAEPLGEQLGHALVVVDDQHSALHVRASSGALSSSGLVSCGPRGSRTRNVEPWPGTEATSIDPPCSRTMPATIESPSPVPSPTGLVVKNGSKILLRFS